MASISQKHQSPILYNQNETTLKRLDTFEEEKHESSAMAKAEATKAETQDTLQNIKAKPIRNSNVCEQSLFTHDLSIEKIQIRHQESSVSLRIYPACTPSETAEKFSNCYQKIQDPNNVDIRSGPMTRSRAKEIKLNTPLANNQQRQNQTERNAQDSIIETSNQQSSQSSKPLQLTTVQQKRQSENVCTNPEETFDQASQRGNRSQLASISRVSQKRPDQKNQKNKKSKNIRKSSKKE